MSHLAIETEQPYSKLKERGISNNDNSPDPLTCGSKISSNKVLDYSADQSVANSIDSPQKFEDSHEDSRKKTGTWISGKTRRTTAAGGSIEWFYSSDDDKSGLKEIIVLSENEQDSQQKKFVNGYPTVVTRRKPTKFYCVKCGFQGVTRVQEKFGKGAWILSSLLFITLFWPCLAFVCCSKTYRDYIHECPSCGHVVGKKKFIL